MDAKLFTEALQNFLEDNMETHDELVVAIRLSKDDKGAISYYSINLFSEGFDCTESVIEGSDEVVAINIEDTEETFAGELLHTMVSIPLSEVAEYINDDIKNGDDVLVNRFIVVYKNGMVTELAFFKH